MSTPAKTQPSPDSGVDVAVVGDTAGGSSYAMYEAQELSPEGAFFLGEVFLEVDEEFTVQLRAGDAKVCATARVVSLDRTRPGMKVAFAMSAEEQQRLTRMLSPGGDES